MRIASRRQTIGARFTFKRVRQQVSEGLAIVCVKFIQIWNVSEER